MKDKSLARRMLGLSSIALVFSLSSNQPLHASSTWEANPASGEWSISANWVGGDAPIGGGDIRFESSTITNVINDLPAVALNIYFESTANAYTINGNDIILAGGNKQVNSSSNVQTFNTNIVDTNGAETVFQSDQASSGFIFNGDVTSSSMIRFQGPNVNAVIEAHGAITSPYDIQVNDGLLLKVYNNKTSWGSDSYLGNKGSSMGGGVYIELADGTSMGAADNSIVGDVVLSADSGIVYTLLSQTGEGNYTKQGGGTVILAGDNSANGGNSNITVQGGTLQVGDGNIGLLGTQSAATVDSGANLTFNLANGLPNGQEIQQGVTNNGEIHLSGSNTYSVTTNISGSGSLIKDGTNTVTFRTSDNSGNISTFTGNTIVSAGTLLLRGELSASDIEVQSQGTVGAISDGSLETTLLGGDLHFQAGSKLWVDLNGTANTLDVTGLVSFDSFDLTNLAGFDLETLAPGTYTLIHGSNFDFSNVGNFNIANAYTRMDGALAYFQQGSLQLVITPVPETSSTILTLAGASFLFVRRRRG